MKSSRILNFVAFVLLIAGSLHASDASREDRVREIVRRREVAARQGKTREWQACDAQLRALPVPADPGMSARMPGKWRSPRHDYLYRADGTWVMLPQEADATHGSWKIKGNRLVEETGAYTIILLDKHSLVYSDGETVFYRTRLGR